MTTTRSSDAGRRSSRRPGSPFAPPARLGQTALPLGAALAVLFPFLFSSGSSVLAVATLALAYVVMALGLNIIVGFAGLLDLGFVAFFAIGAYTVGWLGSGFLTGAGDGAGVHVAVSGVTARLPGVHLNFLLILIAAVVLTTIAGMVIGLPTLRLRGDYISIVTLAFGEIIGRVAINGDKIELASLPLVGGFFGGALGPDQTLTAGRQGITPVDKAQLPFVEPFGLLDIRPWYWLALALAAIALYVSFRLRDSRLGRAWIALREDEVAAVAMGVPSVRSKLLAYGTGAAFGGVSGVFLASYLNTVNADQFQFSFSLVVLGMVILGGIGSIWGVVLGAITLTLINNWLIPDVLNTIPARLGLEIDLTGLTFGIYGFLLVLMMVLRPQGLLPERRLMAEMAADTPARATDGERP